MDTGFAKWDKLTPTVLRDVVKTKIQGIFKNVKACTEMNGRTNSNLIDTLNALSFVNHDAKQKIKDHLKTPPFSRQLKIGEKLTA